MKTTFIFDIKALTGETLDSLNDNVLTLLSDLLTTGKVAILSDFSWKQIQKSFISKLEKIDTKLLNNLSVLTSSGACMYQVWGKYGWVASYQTKLEKYDIDLISKVVNKTLKKFVTEKVSGKQVEALEGFISVKAFGNKIDSDNVNIIALADEIKAQLPSYEVMIVGKDSINISLKNTNKKYGVDEFMKRLQISKDDVVCLASDIVDGGINGFALEMGLDHVSVTSSDIVSKVRGEYLG